MEDVKNKEEKVINLTKDKTNSQIIWEELE